MNPQPTSVLSPRQQDPLQRHSRGAMDQPSQSWQTIIRFALIGAAMTLVSFILVGTTEPVKARHGVASVSTYPPNLNQCPLYPSPHLRMGINVAKDGDVAIDDYNVTPLNAGWYHDYNQQFTPSHPNGMIYHQMLRGGLNTDDLEGNIGALVDANPGSHWVLGNEPDRYGQDEMTPAEFAVFYHKTYTFLKQRDPTSHVAIGAIVQVTPLRLRYLDMVLAEYETRYGTRLETDAWTLHGFNLPENCGWGADIPPGLEAFAEEALPCLTPISQHGDIEIFKERTIAFRQWMADRGYRNYPLIMSEYGILLNPFHGFTYPVVRDYMLASFDFMLNTTDNEIGYPLDSNRLVQQFAWFSLNFYAYTPTNTSGLNGNLYDHGSRLIQPLGRDYADYAKARVLQTIDLQMRDVEANLANGTVNQPQRLRATFVNGGGVAATNVAVRFWQGDPQNNGQLLGESVAIVQVLPDCHYRYMAEIEWIPTTVGEQTIYAEAQADNLLLESDPSNNRGTLVVFIGDEEPATATPTATAHFTVTPSPTSTPLDMTTTPTATMTPVPGMTLTSTSTPTPTSMPTATSTATPTPTASTTATPSPTATLLPDQTSVVVAPGQSGYLRHTDREGRQITVQIAANAVGQQTTFVLQRQGSPSATTGTLQSLANEFTLVAMRNGQELPNFVFQNPIIIEIEYLERDIAALNNLGAREDNVTLYFYEITTEHWQQNGITLLSRDIETNCLRFLVAHLTEFALLVPTNVTATPIVESATIYLPSVMNE